MIKKWESSEINVGNIKPYQKVFITFKCLESLSDVSTVTSPCGCSSGHVSDNDVIVSFKPGDIPRHLAQAGLTTYRVSKTLRVFYQSGEYDLLQFYGNLKR